MCWIWMMTSGDFQTNYMLDKDKILSIFSEMNDKVKVLKVSSLELSFRNT